MSDLSSNAQTFCNYYNQNICRSCSWLEIPYAEQIAKKEARLKEALSFLPELNLIPSAVSPQTGFRNKAKMTVAGTTAKPIIGILGDSGLDDGRELLSCPIHHPKLNAVISALPEWIQAANLIPYQITARTGELKSVILFYSEDSNEMYLRFVLRSQECISRIRKLLPKMQAAFPELNCISANLQPIPHAILEGPEEFILTDKSAIRHQVGNLSLSLSPQAFVQTNSKLARELYQTAANWIAKIKPERFLELFCGQGAFSFFAAPYVKESFGVEINPDAVRAACLTASQMNLPHLHFICADVNSESENSVSALAEKINPDCVLVNPPRRGLGKTGVELILAQKPAHFIYSSCSVESFAEDLQKLSGHYHVMQIQIFDLFPHTPHFETLALLRRQ